MPKVRTLKADFFESEELAAKVSRDARLMIAGLICCCADDHGRFRAGARRIRTAVFMHDDDVSDLMVEVWLKEASDAGIIALYEVYGKPYGWFPNWHKHQFIQADRRVASRLPDPPLKGVDPPSSRAKVSPAGEARGSRPGMGIARQDPAAPLLVKLVEELGVSLTPLEIMAIQAWPEQWTTLGTGHMTMERLIREVDRIVAQLKADGRRIRTVLIEEELATIGAAGVSAAPGPSSPDGEDAMRVCELVADHILHVIGRMPPAWSSLEWRRAADKLVRQYGLPEIEEVIAYIREHEFWGGNIDSAMALHRNYTKIVMRMRADEQETSRMARPGANRRIHGGDLRKLASHLRQQGGDLQASLPVGSDLMEGKYETI